MEVRQKAKFRSKSDSANNYITVNGLNTPVKRQRLSEMLKKQDSAKCSLQESQFQIHWYRWVESNTWKNIYHANSEHKGRVIILI